MFETPSLPEETIHYACLGRPNWRERSSWSPSDQSHHNVIYSSVVTRPAAQNIVYWIQFSSADFLSTRFYLFLAALNCLSFQVLSCLLSMSQTYPNYVLCFCVISKSTRKGQSLGLNQKPYCEAIVLTIKRRVPSKNMLTDKKYIFSSFLRNSNHDNDLVISHYLYAHFSFSFFHIYKANKRIHRDNNKYQMQWQHQIYSLLRA